MRGLAGWLDAETMRLMGLALLHFLWQGVAIAAAAFMGMSLARRASAKYVVAVAMLALMVAAPAVTYSGAGKEPRSGEGFRQSKRRRGPRLRPGNVRQQSAACERRTRIFLARD